MNLTFSFPRKRTWSYIACAMLTGLILICGIYVLEDSKGGYFTLQREILALILFLGGLVCSAGGWLIAKFYYHD